MYLLVCYIVNIILNMHKIIITLNRYAVLMFGSFALIKNRLERKNYVQDKQRICGELVEFNAPFNDMKVLRFTYGVASTEAVFVACVVEKIRYFN